MSPRLPLFAVLSALALAPAADAQTGGAQPRSGHAPPTAGATAAVPLRPVVEQLTCRAACKGIVAGRRGSVVRLTGEGLEAGGQVVFLGRRGRRDDRAAGLVVVGAGAAEAVVPAGARSGRVRVITPDGRRSLTSRRSIVLGGRRGRRDIEARSDVRRVLLGDDSASVSFYVRRPTPVAVDVLRASDGAVVAHWDVAAGAPHAVQSIVWDGTVGGARAPEGRYVWRVSRAGAGPARAARATPGGAGAVTGPSFFLVSHRFPVAGPHTYGDGIGAGRGHMGADVFAPCGTPLVATTGGVVKHVASQERAGHYVVISGDDAMDHVYMHLKDPSPLAKGARVRAGQPVGAVGDTGRATGCHLHFELWTAPGWYTGGRFVDPVPHLRAWDGMA